jgi:hypothetical protein
MKRRVNLNSLDADEVYQAIRDGVHDAMWQMITNATHMPCHDFYDTLKDAVEKATYEALTENLKTLELHVQQVAQATLINDGEARNDRH